MHGYGSKTGTFDLYLDFGEGNDNSVKRSLPTDIAEEKMITVYPNPTHGEVNFQIKIKEVVDTDIRVYDISGNILLIDQRSGFE